MFIKEGRPRSREERWGRRAAPTGHRSAASLPRQTKVRLDFLYQFFGGSSQLDR
jgi:hypothetical protein